MIKRILAFLILNFAALATGGLFTTSGVSSEWYSSLNKAPWTPDGWVFGTAWTLIMICFALYMAHVWKKTSGRQVLVVLYTIQWVLNVAWNPIFFQYQQILLGLICISALTILVGYFLFFYRTQMQWRSLFILPYFLWLLIATSLNAYIFFQN
jgi:tryptophan-rich sensory protein